MLPSGLFPSWGFFDPSSPDAESDDYWDREDLRYPEEDDVMTLAARWSVSPMDIESLAAAGSMLGSAGVIVMDDSTCMVNALLNILRFYHHESCGQCTPCREGTGWLEKVVHRIEFGHGRKEDLDVVFSVCDRMVGKTICVLADAAAFPATSIIEKFRDEFIRHIEEKKCSFRKQPALSGV